MSNLSRQFSPIRQHLISDGRLAPYGCFLPAIDLNGNSVRLSVAELAAKGFNIAAEARARREMKNGAETNIIGNVRACEPANERITM